MNETVERLIGASAALIAALDAHDVDAIETVLPAYDESIVALKSPGDWQRSPGLFVRLKHALELAEAARIRIRMMADANRQRTDLLAAAAGRFDCMPVTYAPGR